MIKIPDGKDYWLKETYRYLTLAAIGASDKSREHIDKAMECLEKYEEEMNDEILHDSRIREMVLELVAEIDYDIYKNMYVKDTAELPPKEVDVYIQTLVNIVKKYL